MTDNLIRVFVSSTSQDLADHRAVVRNVVLDMHWHPVMMEHMGASPNKTVSACLDLVETCDLLVLVVAFRQGWVPSVDQGGDGVTTVTAFELAHARTRNIPILAILADEDWPGKLWEKTQAAREWVDKFRADLNLPAVFFSHEADSSLPSFRTTLHAQLVDYRQDILAKEVRRSQVDINLNYLLEARDGILAGDNTPFIGPFIYGEGPLSPFALARALAPDLEDQNVSLAIAAEHREQRTGSRYTFLNQLSQVIEEQSVQAPSCRVLSLIPSITKPWFIIYTGFDMRIEELLDSHDVPYVVVTHISRSYEARYDGKVLLLRKDREAQICGADELEIGNGENVIYRPLGSPLLHNGLDEDLELDTVVITESDYLNFLGRNYYEATQIPSRFARWLDRRPLVFLGYAMELWHFRLVMKVFQSVGGHYRRASTFAVRKSATPMEDIAWRRLSTKRIPIGLDEFAETLSESETHASRA